MKDNEIFVFLSHSHLDYEKVRMVRDLLEKEGFRPLMFFLRCLEKKGYDKLTKKLIKEEIDCRQRFVLCESENAKQSDWVQFEVDYIKKSNRPYEVIDLDWPKVRIAESIRSFKIRSTVFLSYPRALSNLASAVNEKLKLLDFDTFFDADEFMTGEVFEEQLNVRLNKAAEEGYVLAFIDYDLQENTFQYKEIIAAMNLSARIIPIITAPISNEARRLFADLYFIDVQNLSVSQASEYIVDSLMKSDLKYNQ